LHCNKKDRPLAISQFRRHRAYFGRGSREEEKIGYLDENTRAIFGRSYAAEPNVLIEQLRKDGAIAEADTLLLTIPNQLGVAYNVHVIEAILTTALQLSVGAEDVSINQQNAKRSRREISCWAEICRAEIYIPRERRVAIWDKCPRNRIRACRPSSE
jgi:hypothetical protein